MKATILLLFSFTGAVAAPAAERWGVFEIELAGPAAGNPYVNVQWSATFAQGDRRITVPGFWDGGGAYRVRFSPPTAGEWRYETRSATPELDGKTGSFSATAPTGNNHGPVEVVHTFYLRRADGTPYHQFGTTCYAWVHQPKEIEEQTLHTLAASPFNKIRFCVFPKSYVYNKNEPGLFAFQKGSDGKFDFDRPDPGFWRHLEQRILDLGGLGIEADLILWHPYDRWGFASMSDGQDDRYLRHCIARLSAFRNVWWSLANEYDFLSNLDGKHPGRKTMDDWDRFFAILEKEDPHRRLRGIHNGARWYDHTKEWVKFTGTGGGRMRWNFGDGATSDGSSPAHTFEQSGLYVVTLTVTDAEGSSSQAFLQIAVDRGSDEPLVRAGFPTGEYPPLKLHGTAKRSEDGSLRLPGGAPWGWVEAGAGPIEDLRGLRSFTILGWLKPESLEVGSGGNRILYCLNGSRSGIDLVCHAEGCLRLAVNEWPDGIHDDSSPGRLQVGRWTAFAVTYDSTRSGDNVHWYFGPPVERPGPAALALDRVTSYGAGPVAADIGFLAIGNFNEAMHGFGLDRQFRGEMRALQVFGSRIGGRGALGIEAIKSRFP